MAGLMLVVAAMGGLVAICAMAAPAKGQALPVKFISNFTGPKEVEGFVVTGADARWSSSTEDGAPVEGTALEKEGEKAGSLYLQLIPGKTYTTVEYAAERGMPADWQGYDRLVMHFENGSEFLINLWLTVTDASGAKYFADNLWINRAKTRVEVPLAELRTAAGEPLDLANVKTFKLDIRSAEKFYRDLWLFRFQLEGAEKPVVKASAKSMLFNFSLLGAAPLPGSKLVHEKTAYADWRGYGWMPGTPELTATYFKKPDRLTAAWVWQDLGNQKATFRVDLPDGKYRARFYGGNYNSKALAVKAFTLSVDGRKVAEKKVDPKTYYTTKGHFFGMDHWYQEGEDPYDVYVAKYYQTYDFSFAVKGGHAEFTWTKTLAAFGLLIAPTGDEFVKAADAIEKARRKDVAEKIHAPEPPKGKTEADRIEKGRGFVIWSRNYLKSVGLYDRPAAEERNPKSLKVKAAMGERGNVAFTLTPIRPMGAVEVKVSDLMADEGGKMPASAIQVRVVRFMWQGWPASIAPGILYPTTKIPAAGMYNQTVWLTVTPPKDSAPGMHRGTVRIKTKAGGEIALPLDVYVRPFEFTNNHDRSFALWRCSDYNMNYALRYFMPAKMGYFRQLLDAECADQKAHGATAFYFNPPIIKGVKGSKVQLDFTIVEEEANAAKKYGFCTAARPGMVFLLPDIARYLMKETRYGDFMEPEDMSPELPEADRVEEFSDLFNARYIDAAKQIHAFYKKKGLHVLLYPADEPRERNTNRWNRNLEDTLRYCRMIKENIPDAQIYVDPMRDENAGVDYLPILDVVDVIGTHPWDQSKRIVERCSNESFPILWYFNAIMWDRYDFGLENAAADSRGTWQWHFMWDLLPFQPFHSSFKWGVTVPGPEGPFDTPAHELIATGISDYLYLATLEAKITAAKDAGTAESAVESAERTLAQFYDNAPPYPTREDYEGDRKDRQTRREVIAGKTLDQWRDAFAEHIQEIDAQMTAL